MSKLSLKAATAAEDGEDGAPLRPVLNKFIEPGFTLIELSIAESTSWTRPEFKLPVVLASDVLTRFQFWSSGRLKIGKSTGRAKRVGARTLGRLRCFPQSLGTDRGARNELGLIAQFAQTSDKTRQR
jgi:hypothetical protein